MDAPPSPTLRTHARPRGGLRKPLCSTLLLALLLVTADAAAEILGGMIDPTIDTEGEPLSYFAAPTAVMGAPLAPVASEVTPGGRYVYTGFGELMFFTGNPPEPINVRIKGMERGYLPVIRYHLRRDGVRYDFAAVAIDPGGELSGLPRNLIRVTVTNEADDGQPSSVPLWCFTLSPVRLDGLADYRFRQLFDLIPAAYVKGEDAFNPEWRFEMRDSALVRDRRIIYVYPSSPTPDQLSLSLGDKGLGRVVLFFTSEVNTSSSPSYRVAPDMPMGVATLRVPHTTGESRELVFKLPLVPVPTGPDAAQQIEGTNLAVAFNETMSFWEDLVGKAAPFEIPESKIQNAMLANTIFNMLAIDQVGDDYIVNVNKFQYHRHYPGNGAAMIAAMDFFGLHAYKMQAPNGSFPVPHKLASQSIETLGDVFWAL